MGDYRSLNVWRVAHELVLDLYDATKGFPPDERYGLIAQVRRSAASIPTNIAEGSGRNSPAELARFCRIGLGSANELDYQLLLARDLGYLADPTYVALSDRNDHVRRMLSKLVYSLEPG